MCVPQQLSGTTALTDRLLFLDPIVKDQARMGSSNMPGGSTPVSSASMMSGQFCQIFLVLGVLKHLYVWGGWEDPGGRVQPVGGGVLVHLPRLGTRTGRAAEWESDKKGLGQPDLVFWSHLKKFFAVDFLASV